MEVESRRVASRQTTHTPARDGRVGDVELTPCLMTLCANSEPDFGQQNVQLLHLILRF